MRSFASSCLVALLASGKSAIAAADVAEASMTSNLRGAMGGLESSVSAAERRATEVPSYTVWPPVSELERAIPMCPDGEADGLSCCIDDRAAVDVTEYEYGQADLDGKTVPLMLKIYRLEKLMGEKAPKLPVVVYIPGGNFEPYVRDIQHHFRATAIARRGFAVAMIHYREADLPEDLGQDNFVQLIQPNYYNYLMMPVHDILTAVKWLPMKASMDKSLNIDTSNIAMFGCQGGAMFASSASVLDVTDVFPELADVADNITATVAVGASVPWAIVRTFGLALRSGDAIPPYLLVHARDPWFYPYAMAQGAQVVLAQNLGARMRLITREVVEGQFDFVCDELHTTPGVHGTEQTLFNDLVATGLRTMDVEQCQLP